MVLVVTKIFVLSVQLETVSVVDVVVFSATVAFENKIPGAPGTVTSFKTADVAVVEFPETSV